MKVRIVYIDREEPFEKYGHLMPLISEKRRERVERFRFDRMKLVSLFAELLIRYGIIEALGIKNKEIEFGYGEHGKPYLLNHPEYCFSVSHSGSCIAFADYDKPVGVDVERLSDANMRIAGRFFTENEYKHIESSKDRDKEFYRVWTAKEAYIKMLGTGLSTSLSSFDVLNGSVDCRTIFLPDYSLSVCAEGLRSFESEQLQQADLLDIQ